MTRHAPKLSALADQYDLLLCDIWGVLHDGKAHFKHAKQAIKSFKETHGPVILISNSPRPKSDLIAQLKSLDIDDDAYSDIVSSGDATRAYLRQFAPSGLAWRIGDVREKNLYEGIEIDLSGTPETAAFIACSSPYDDEKDVPEDYRARFDVAASRNIAMICANPDKVVHRGEKLIYCAGALAELYAQLGGTVIMAGKPYAPIYDLCFEAAKALMSSPLERPRVLCIGDGLPTDIAGANAQNLDVLFISSGIHREDTLKDGAFCLDLTKNLLAQAGLTAKYASFNLEW